MRPSKKLLHAFEEFELTPKCLYRKQMDCIRLKDSKKKLIEYEDTSTMRSMRPKLEDYNNLLHRAHIKQKRNKMVNNYLVFNIQK